MEALVGLSSFLPSRSVSCAAISDILHLPWQALFNPQPPSHIPLQIHSSRHPSKAAPALMSSLGWDWQSCKVAPILPPTGSSCPSKKPCPGLASPSSGSYLPAFSKKPWQRPLSLSHPLPCCTQRTASTWIKTPTKQLPLRETGIPPQPACCSSCGQVSQPATPGASPTHWHSCGQAWQSSVLGSGTH